MAAKILRSERAAALVEETKIGQRAAWRNIDPVDEFYGRRRMVPDEGGGNAGGAGD